MNDSLSQITYIEKETHTHTHTHTMATKRAKQKGKREKTKRKPYAEKLLSTLTHNTHTDRERYLNCERLLLLTQLEPHTDNETVWRGQIKSTRR